MTAIAQNIAPDAPAPKSGRKIPAYLVSEVIDGIPFYYRGYRAVLNKSKTLEDIMADSGLQLLLKEYISELLKAGLDRKLYRIWNGEIGNHIDRRNNLGLDVVVFEKSVLTPDKITTRYVDVPAKIVVEIDVNVELPDKKTDLFEEYVVRKVNRLFAFGTEKVIWFFSKSKKVISATPHAPWQFFDWGHDIELLSGIVMNIANHLKAEGINPDIRS
jgi:hypothetical protein